VIFPLDGGPERTGVVSVKVLTDVEGERLALCDLNNTNTRVGHYGGHGHGWLVVTCWITRYRMYCCISIRGIRSPKGILFSGQS
jgi:hypothetical protein